MGTQTLADKAISIFWRKAGVVRPQVIIYEQYLQSEIDIQSLIQISRNSAGQFSSYITISSKDSLCFANQSVAWLSLGQTWIRYHSWKWFTSALAWDNQFCTLQFACLHSISQSTTNFESISSSILLITGIQDVTCRILVATLSSRINISSTSFLLAKLLISLPSKFRIRPSSSKLFVVYGIHKLRSKGCWQVILWLNLSNLMFIMPIAFLFLRITQASVSLGFTNCSINWSTSDLPS